MRRTSHWSVEANLFAECLRECADHGLDRPVTGEVELLDGPVRLGTPSDRFPEDVDGSVLHQLLGEQAHGVVVAVRLVHLEHRELGVVRGVGALVPEVPVDLEDPVDSTDEQSLEVELGRDSQVERHVVGVDVGDEGTRVGAAVHHLEHGRLGLDVAVALQRLA